MDTSIAKQIQEQLRKYYPGTVVPLAPNPPDPLPEDFPVLRVYPVQFTQIGKYNDILVSAISKLRLDQDFTGLVKSLADIVFTDLMAVVDDCCVPKISEINPYHDVIPLVVEAWIKENFMGERLNPWKRAMETLIERVTGQKVSLSEELSKFSSLAVTQLKKSSGSGKLVSPISVGATSSSGHTSESQTVT